MLRNNVFRPELGLPGRILAGLLPGMHLHRPSGRPSAGRGADFDFPGISPAKIRPGRPIYSPEALLRNKEYKVEDQLKQPTFGKMQLFFN
jgi:hypothetical protein